MARKETCFNDAMAVSVILAPAVSGGAALKVLKIRHGAGICISMITR